LAPLDPLPNLTAQACGYDNLGIDQTSDIPDIQVGTFSCDGSLLLSEDSDPYSHFNQWEKPTILARRTLIVVDFAALQSPISLMEVRIGRTPDTAKTLAHTKPVTLLPGFNLVGYTSTHIRQTFSSTSLSAIGLFEVSSPH